MQNTITFIIISQTLNNYTLEMFSPLQSRTDMRNLNLDGTPPFVTDNVPFNSVEGEIRAGVTGSRNGIIHYDDLGQLKHFSNNGLNQYAISTSNSEYSYRSFNEWLKTVKGIYVTKVRMQADNINQLTKPWALIKRMPTGSKTREDIDNGNIINPTQFQNNIAETYLNRHVDKYTSLQIQMIPSVFLILSIDFKEVY